MRPLARAVAILCLSTVVSCSENNPTTRPIPRTEVTVPVSVFDVDGVPMAAFVYFMEAGHGTITVETGTDPVSVRLPTTDLKVIVSAKDMLSGYVIATIPEFRVRDGVRFEYRYAGARLSGTVSLGGQAFDGVWVEVTDGPTVRPSMEDPPQNWVRQISSGGRIEFVLPPGSYLMAARPPSDRPELVRMERHIDVTGDAPLDLDFSGHDTQVLVSVKGQPIGDANVTAQGADVMAWVRTDATGTGRRMVLPGGDYDFSVRSVMGVMEPLIVPRTIATAGTVSLDFTGATWTGTLRRKADLSPVASALVVVREPGSVRMGRQQTDAEGRFQMIVTPGVTHTIGVNVPHYGDRSIDETFTTSGDATFDLLVDVPPAP
jgi:hypothetical protein